MSVLNSAACFAFAASAALAAFVTMSLSSYGMPCCAQRVSFVRTGRRCVGFRSKANVCSSALRDRRVPFEGDFVSAAFEELAKPV